MKTLVFMFVLLAPSICRSQAHLGETFTYLQLRYPEIEFKLSYADNGIMFTSAKQRLGTFIYYFDSETELTNLCLQFPNDIPSLNAQVEIYNNKYVIVSEKEWKAYLDGGGIMNIELLYNEEIESYVFIYKN